jgi:DNA-binding NarL/FixJ family response regulator
MTVTRGLTKGGESPPHDAREAAKTVLVVDDDAPFLRSLAHALEREGFAALTYASPAGALELARRHAPDLVLLDLHFDERHAAEGLDCTRELLASGYRGAVVILSSDDSFAMAHEAARAGAHGYLVKRNFDRFGTILRCFLEPREDQGGGSRFLPPAAEAYLRSRGLEDRDLELLREYAWDFGREKCLATRLSRGHEAVRKHFERIRDLMGALSQVDFGRMLGVLSCFARVPKR